MTTKRSWRKPAMLVLALILFLVTVYTVLKETREPFLWLYIDDLIHPKPPPLTLSLPDGLGLRLYSDPRPHTGKVARLQKALALTVDGRERIEEGFGFGLPLVLVGGQQYLSRTASVEQEGDALVKHYDLDILDTPSGFLRRKYEPVPSIGTVTVTYTVAGSEIQVKVDLTGVRAPWDLAYIMNEQGARFFTRYEEPGLAVEGADFGRWQPTVGRQGCVVSGDRSIRFCVETEEETHRYYGRERYHQYYPIGIYTLSWAGLDLELSSESAPMDRFDYRIRLQRDPRE